MRVLANPLIGCDAEPRLVAVSEAPGYPTTLSRSGEIENLCKLIRNDDEIIALKPLLVAIRALLIGICRFSPSAECR